MLDRIKTKEEIKPCKHCDDGGYVVLERYIFPSSYEYRVRCRECGLNSGLQSSIRKALEVWNVEANRQCLWLYNHDAGAYETECDALLIWEPYGTPSYCPNCGKSVADVVSNGSD